MARMRSTGSISVLFGAKFRSKICVFHRGSQITNNNNTCMGRDRVRLSEDIIGITIVEVKTKAALEATNKYLSVSATLVVIKRDLLMCCNMRNGPLRQLDTNLDGG